MEEFSVIIQKIREDKNNFSILIEKMKPLMNKYTKLLYKDEKEDVYSEMTLALWEAVMKMEYHDDDAKCMTFLCTALRNKFLELYRRSKKYHDNCTAISGDEITYNFEENFSDVILKNDLIKIIEQYDGVKKVMYQEILFNETTDSQIASKHNVSRQYVNRLRRNVYKLLESHYFMF